VAEIGAGMKELHGLVIFLPLQSNMPSSASTHRRCGAPV